MSFENGMNLVSELLSRAQALAGLTARLRLEDMNGSADPLLRAQLERVMDHLGGETLVKNLSDSERTIMSAYARSYFRQALDLMENPDRPGSWEHTDPVLLQAQGSASMVVASLLHEAGFGKPDARILDVGTGVGGLAIALCKAYPLSKVVGLDPWEPSLEIARKNISEAGMESRITLHRVTVESYEDADGFDLIWLPAFFIPEAVLDDALRNLHRITRPGGSIVVGCTFDVTGEPLYAAVDDLMTVRSGGTPLTPGDAAERLKRAGFSDVRQIERTWNAPLGLAAGVRSE